MSDQQIGQWKVTGEMVSVSMPDVNRVPEYDPKTRAHLWTWAVLYRASPEAETPMLDGENLIKITGPGCYYCETLFNARDEKKPCTGPA